jgi:hypothetical protein
MVRVKMIVANSGEIYWLMRAGKRDIRIMKLNTKTAEMGDDDYIKEVGQLSTSEVFFFLQFKKKFYIMDESKNIRVYAQDPVTHMLE